SQRGLSTSGALARKAAERTAEMNRDDFGRDRIGFVGFDVINGSTRTIFKNIGRLGIADFFWDEPLSLTRDLPKDSTAFIPLKNYINRLKKDFPMPAGFTIGNVRAPEGTVYAVPSASMQTKLTGEILQRLTRDRESHKDRPDSTAIVLPAPGVLTSLLHSLPDESKLSLNITMGLPVRHTPFATFLSAVVKIYLRSTDSKDGLNFLSEDVERVLNHPSVLMLGSDDVMKAKAFLAENRRIVVPVGALREHSGSVAFLFNDVASRGRKIVEVGKLFGDIIETMINRLEPFVEQTGKDKEKPGKTVSHEMRLLAAYKEVIESITDTALRFSKFHELSDLSFDTRTFIVLLEKLIHRDSLNMSGAPMRGMQVMGPLETRSLDFDNVIMVSANERTFPKKTFFKSLIPHTIRVGYGLTTVEHSELQYAWIFYNLISRSKRAVFMYDARQGKVGSNEMSRYLFQLKHVFTGINVKNETLYPVALKGENTPIVIEKTDSVREQTRRFLKNGDRHLSASSIKDYLKCPLLFYLRQVKGLSDDVKPADYINSATIGTVIHAVFEDFYKPLKGIEISPRDLMKYIHPSQIHSSVKTKLDKEFYRGKYADNLDNMPGEAMLLAEVIGDKIIEVLRNESKLRTENFTYEGGEKRAETSDRVVEWQLTPDLCIRFKYSIDRIDRLSDGTLRFIDYKSGDEATNVLTVDDIFGTPGKEPSGAIFQILAYSNVYASTNADVKDITPEILKIFDSEGTISKPLTIGSTRNKKTLFNITSYKDVPDFQGRLAERLMPMFDDNTSFVQTENAENCKYCQFKDLCNRAAADNQFH
ncbi:MAG: PD-(D/E)XK nuclease family protein, partial [Muribaculaceae bacterium]|nr:PD-(D/E)XK nuclease family protein [Muribaculaceae bacterium]